MKNELPEEITVDELKASLDYYRGIIAGLGDSETDDFNRSVYFQHSGDLYIAIEIIEKYKRYFEELHHIPGKGATLHEGINEKEVDGGE